MDASDANARAVRLRRDVSARKRAISKNKQEMHGLMAEFDRLQEECARLGIRLEVNTRPKGGRSGNSDIGTAGAGDPEEGEARAAA